MASACCSTRWVAVRFLRQRPSCRSRLVGQRLFCSPGAGDEGQAASVAAQATGVATTRKPPTARQLYEAAVASTPSRKARGLQAAGAVLAASGLGVLAWQNWAALLAMATWNALGGGLLSVGGALAAASIGGPRRGGKGRRSAAAAPGETRSPVSRSPRALVSASSLCQALPVLQSRLLQRPSRRLTQLLQSVKANVRGA
ncbi:unnamed protein product [Prorocentrum cordatum]|uniref:Uncharacterized protein n=1 Tax=Prorocentrum cordatum TaxID=2364126 RepID=A0ABN9R4T9_9DINO|nr:unnamed protein product [Polarella glacialis]